MNENDHDTITVTVPIIIIIMKFKIMIRKINKHKASDDGNNYDKITILILPIMPVKIIIITKKKP